MKTVIHSKKFIYTLLTLIMIAGIARFSYGFFIEKKGTHSDEEWSFGLANSYYEPYIYSSDNGIYKKNSNQWLSGNILKDYLTVQKGERFSFGSVYYNMACDTHPPLYFFILHFLSSFFVDQYIPALGLIINLICYIILSIYFYRLLTVISQSHYLGIIGVLFNTFSIATLSMVIYIRMYMMVAMFAIMFAYYHAIIYYSCEEKNNLSTYIKLAIVSCLGALTHHFFLPYAFIIAIVFCIWGVIKKQWGFLIKYMIFISLGIILSIAIFPATLNHLFGITNIKYRDTALSENQSKLSYKVFEKSASSVDANSQFKDIPHYKWHIFKYCFCSFASMLFIDYLGFSPISPFTSGIYLYIPIIIGVLFVFSLAILFLFRNNDNFHNLKKQKFLLIKEKLNTNNLHINYFLVSMLLSVITMVIVCTKKIDLFVMGEFSNRYLFIIYPVFCLIIIYILFLLVKALLRKKYIYITTLSIIFLLTTIYNNYTQHCIYFFREETYNLTQLHNISANSNIIIVSSSPWLLTIYAPILSDCDNFYFTTYQDFLQNSNYLRNNISDNLLLLLDTSYLLPENDDINYQDTYQTNYPDYFYENLYLTKIQQNYSDAHVSLVDNAINYGIPTNIYKISK